MKKILVDGPPNWSDRDTVQYALYNNFVELGASNDIILITGTYNSGVDLIAKKFWESLGLESEQTDEMKVESDLVLEFRYRGTNSGLWSTDAQLNGVRVVRYEA